MSKQKLRPASQFNYRGPQIVPAKLLDCPDRALRGCFANLSELALDSCAVLELVDACCSWLQNYMVGICIPTYMYIYSTYIFICMCNTQ